MSETAPSFSHSTNSSITRKKFVKLKSRSRRYKGLKILLSPATAFTVSYAGYYAFAGYSNAFMPDSSLGAILSRVLMLVMLVLSFFYVKKRKRMNYRLLVLPVLFFWAFYLLRIWENTHAGVPIAFDVNYMYFLFIFNGIFACLVLMKIGWLIRVRHIVKIMPVVCLIFLVGLLMNYDLLLESSEHIMQLDKINHISMANTAATFLIYYFLAFNVSKTTKTEAMIFGPILLLVFVYAQSRGATYAMVGALAVYFIVSKGKEKYITLLSVTLIIIVLGYFVGTETADVVIERMQTTEDASTEAHMESYQTAWQQFMNDFWIGRYIVDMETTTYPHNFYLESLMAVGLLGSLPLFIHLGFATNAALRTIRNKKYGLIGSLVAVLYFRDAINVAGSGAVWSNTEFWITSTLILSLWYFKKPTARSTRSRVKKRHHRKRSGRSRSSRRLQHVT